MYHEAFMRRAIELSATALATPGTEPFGAVVVRDGKIVGEGVNRSSLHFDPTSHGETEAIRDACQKLETLDLSDCDLYTSCEPCALCVAAMTIAGIRQLYYAASLAQSKTAFAGMTQAARRPIDVDLLRAETGAAVDARRLPAVQALSQEAVEILGQWAALKTSA